MLRRKLLRTGINKLGLAGLGLGHLAIDMQTSSLAIMIPLLYTRFGLDYASAALIVTVNSLTAYMLQPLFGLLSDKRSMRWILPLCCALAAGGMVLVLFLPEYWLVLLAVVVSGMGSAAFHPEASRNANYVSGNNKATGVSIFFFSGNVGSALGPISITLLLGIFGTAGALGMLFPAVVAFLLLWRLLPIYTEYAAGRSVKKTTTVLPGRRKRVGLLSLLLAIISLRAMIQTGLITFIPLYFATLPGNNKDYAAFLLSVYVFCAAIGTLVGGPLADRLGHKPVMVTTLMLVMPLLLLFLNSSGVVQVISLGLAGISLVSASSITIVMAQETLPNNLGLATGLTLGLGFGAGGLGASALGKYADFFGLSQTMLVIVLLALPLVFLSMWLPTRSRKPQQPEPALPEVAETSAVKV
jgi:FSR family fosmidomycin resistance protein-like MFS transporter